VKKVVISRNGGPDVLKVVNSERPILNRDHVLVDVEAVAVNYLDVISAPRKGRRP
jgi:NADPH:quinone reductase-like Zn-dependent oxidoreductase